MWQAHHVEALIGGLTDAPPVELGSHTFTSDSIIEFARAYDPQPMHTDPERARATARGYAAVYLNLPNYVNNLRELGFSDSDFENGGSDALIDAVIPWGDPDTLGEHVRAHYREMTELGTEEVGEGRIP